MGMTADLAGTKNQSGIAQTAQKYAQRQDFPGTNFDTLNPGDAVQGQADKVWQHQFAESGGGGWFMADAPGAKPAAGGGSPLQSMAMQGLQQAGSSDLSAAGYQELPAPGAADPQLGTRIYPEGQPRLAMLPRVY